MAIARRNGDAWWLGAMTNWDAREIDVPLGFLGAGAHEAKIFADGPITESAGTSLVVSSRKVAAGDKLALRLAPDGGAAVILTPVR